MSAISARLAELGIELPKPTAPVANYVPFVRHGDMVQISGQLSNDASGGVRGTIGVDVGLEDARRAARLCGLNLLAQLQAACGGDLDRVERIVRLGAFVQAGPAFLEIPQVVNGCSDLMVEVFGDAGQHARSAVGVYRLPLGFAVEVDLVAQVR